MKLFKEALKKYFIFLAIGAVLLSIMYWLFETSLWQSFFNALAYCSISKSRLFIFLFVMTLSFSTLFYFIRSKRAYILAVYVLLITAIVYGLAHTIVFEGKVRSIYLYQYKFKHIKIEKLYYRKAWGWVDKVHYRADHYREINHKIEESKEGFVEVELFDAWRAPLGFPVKVYRKYRINRLEAQQDQWAVVAGIMMDFMEQSEQTQEDSPWYHGNQLSAWQFDDMSSNLLACLDEGGWQKGESIYDIDQLNLMWAQEGFKDCAGKNKAPKCLELYE